MSNDGSHLVCEKHQKKTYCVIRKEWVCNTCELEREEPKFLIKKFN